MKKPRGKALLVCDCTKPYGTPLILRQGSWNLVCLLENTQVSQGRLTGNCPCCHRFVDVRGTPKSAKTKAPPACEQIRGDAKSWLNHILHCFFWDFTNSIGKEATQQFILPPHVRLVFSERMNNCRTVVLRSLRGPQKLRIDCEVKERFARRVFKANVPTERLPDWYPGGTNFDFISWNNELREEQRAREEQMLIETARAVHEVAVRSKNCPVAR